MIAFWSLLSLFLVCAGSALYLFDDAIYWRIFGKSPEDSGNSTYVLPAKYYEGKEILRYSYDKHVHGIDDFESWKNLILSKHPLNPIPPIDLDDITPTLIYTADRDSYTLEKYSFPSVGFDDGLFYKLVPDIKLNKGKAILVLSGTGDQGFNDVIGEPTKWSPYYYQDEIGKKLVLEGYTVYAPEWYGAGERGIDFKHCVNEHLNCNHALFIKMSNHYDINVNDIMADDVYRVTSIIDSEFDRIGITGLSLGGSATIQSALSYPDMYDVVASVSGHISLHDQYASLNFGDLNLLLYDGRDILAMFAPKPLYLSLGEREVAISNFEAVTNYTSNYVRDAYILHASEDKFVNILHQGSHEYHAESLIRFFSDYL